MQSAAKSVAAYMKELPEERRASLTRLRALCRASFRDCQETMNYGMPCYEREGVVEVSFASQANYISVYMSSKVLKANHAALKGLKVGKGCVRYSSPARIDWAVLEKLLADAARTRRATC